MRTNDYCFIRETVYRHSSINLGPDKKELVASRIKKRLSATSTPDIEAYCNYLRGPTGAAEIQHLIDVISTNHTFFFREQSHFDALGSLIIPDLLARRRQARWPRLRVWSAACSSGEEPYSISISLAEIMNDPSKRWDHEIEATDISHRILERAARGIYPDTTAAKVPAGIRSKYFQVGYGPQAGFQRVKPVIRERIHFRQLNLLEQSPPGSERFHIIFCRNVMIYFDPPTQERLVKRLRDHLVPGGYLIVGHSESLNGINHGLKSVGSAIYQNP
jgi:chemotaxis protein methyltransferase CheR